MKTRFFFCFFLIFLIQIPSFSKPYLRVTEWIAEIPITKSDSVDCEREKREIEVQINHLIANKYLEYCEKLSIAPPLGYLGWEKVKMYWDKVDKLQETRRLFDETDRLFYNFIIDKAKNDSLVKAVSVRKESEDYSSWMGKVHNIIGKRYPSEYWPLRQKRDSLLGISNRESLAFIIDDYSKKNILFPVDWIPSNNLARFRADSTIFLLETRLKALEKKCPNEKSEEQIIDYSSRYKLSNELIEQGYYVVFVNDKRDVVVLGRKDQKRTFNVGEYCELNVLLNRDEKQRYNVTMKPSERNDISFQYANEAAIWISGKSMVRVGTSPCGDKFEGPIACRAKKIAIYVGQSKSSNVCCKPDFWDNLEEYEFYYPVTWK